MTLVGNVQLISGSAESLPQILEYLETKGIQITTNPDLYVRSHIAFGIEEARELSARAASRALGERRVFVITTGGITHEAQNALLKTLEEALGNALFVLVVPSPEMLLPTVRSRSQIIEIESIVQKSALDAVEFVKSSPTKRLDMLKPLLEKEEGEARDIGSIIIFLSSLERILAKGLPETKPGIEAVYRAREYVGDKGSLVKPLLEQVALLA